ncbi:MAG TPA: glycine oxidase ThiO [Candidatus Acidoferrales bacterium]|nr:glycine oxidase ThiO [Candidatus Acidoferrales bacterium]
MLGGGAGDARHEYGGVDVLIVGAGLIGLASAFELAQRGASVRVFDSHEPAMAASWAGAGMLAPFTEAPPSPELAAFCADSLARYPGFVCDLRGWNAGDPELHLDGLLEVAYGAAESERLRARVDALRARGVRAHWLDGQQARALEPALGPQVVGASLVEDEGHVDNRRLGRALRAACVARGVRVTTDVGATAIEADGRRVRGLRTAQGFATAPVIVNTAGAWAGTIEGVPSHAAAAVRPVKGQMFALAMPPGFVRRVVWFPGGYAVPRTDGRLLIGATVEEAGFDTRVTAEAMRSLLDAALRAMPSIGAFALVETWAGLRPGSADGLPFIGATSLDGYFVAAGHYRNGILLTPSTATMVADAVEGRALPAYAAAFSPKRRTAIACGAAR